MQKEQQSLSDADVHEGLHFLLVDDHEMTAFAAAHMLRSSFPGAESTIVTTVDKAIEALRCGSRFSTTIVLLDLVLEDGTGMEFFTRLKNESIASAVATLVLSGKTAQQDIDACRAAGARGYVCKRANWEAVTHAINEILAGRESFAQGEVAAEPVMPPQFVRLAPGVRRVFPLLLLGLKNKEIGSRLNLTEDTVKQHVNKIYKALDVKTKGELIARFGRNG